MSLLGRVGMILYPGLLLHQLLARLPSHPFALVVAQIMGTPAAAAAVVPHLHRFGTQAAFRLDRFVEDLVNELILLFG